LPLDLALQSGALGVFNGPLDFLAAFLKGPLCHFANVAALLACYLCQNHFLPVAFLFRLLVREFVECVHVRQILIYRLELSVGQRLLEFKVIHQFGWVRIPSPLGQVLFL